MQSVIAPEYQLYFGDCLDIMKTLEPVSHIITDPPYEDRYQKNFCGLIKRTDGGMEGAPLNFQGIDKIMLPSCEAFKRLSKGWILNFCSPEIVGTWRDTIEAVGLKYKKACCWNKPDAMPQMNGQGPASSFENIVASWGGKGHSRWNAGGKRGMYTHNTNQPDRDGTHPTEKPVPLMMELIADFTNHGDTILDPFMGSATTGIAALKLGRKFIGIEMDEKYYQLAVRRMQAVPGIKHNRAAPEEFALTQQVFKIKS